LIPQEIITLKSSKIPVTFTHHSHAPNSDSHCLPLPKRSNSKLPRTHDCRFVSWPGLAACRLRQLTDKDSRSIRMSIGRTGFSLSQHPFVIEPEKQREVRRQGVDLGKKKKKNPSRKT